MNEVKERRLDRLRCAKRKAESTHKVVLDKVSGLEARITMKKHHLARIAEIDADILRVKEEF